MTKWDKIFLDSYILPMLAEKQKEQLKAAGILGKYVLDKENGCYRTQFVLRLSCLPLRRWQRFVNGLDDGEMNQAEVDQLLGKVLRLHIRYVLEMVARVSVINCGLSSQRETLCRLWKQKTCFCKCLNASKELKSNSNERLILSISSSKLNKVQ